jgi:hypothetical protein
MSTRLKETQAGSTQTFKAALTTLRNKSKIDIENITSDIFELKQEVKLLEKQRRQIRSLLLDLSYGLQEDCDRTAMRGKETASSAQLELLELEATAADGASDGMRRNVTPMIMKLTNDLPLSEAHDHSSHPTGTLVSVVSSRRRDLEIDNYYTGGSSSGVIIGSSGHPQTQSQQQQQHKKLLVDKWLKQLQLHLSSSDLGKAIKKGLEITDPHLLSPPNSAQHSFSSEIEIERTSSPPEGTASSVPSSSSVTQRRQDLMTKNIVPFEVPASATAAEVDATVARVNDGKGHEDWRKLSSEELRVSLTALECRSVWRKFQRSSAKYLSNSFQTSEAEWFHFIESKDQQAQQHANQHLSPHGHLLRNGITISLPNEGSIRHTFPLSRGSVRFQDEDISKPTKEESETESKKIPRKFPSQEAILIQGVKSFQDWQIFRRICLNAVCLPPLPPASIHH